jgi:hypothetical protein
MERHRNNMLRNREDCILRIGIIGNGDRGKAIQQLQCPSIDFLVYDINPELCVPLETMVEEMEQCDLIFHCLPVPMNHNACSHTTLLSDSIISLKNPYQIIYAFTPIGFSESMGCCLMSEWIMDPIWEDEFTTPHWIIGLPSSEHAEECKKRITTLLTTCHAEGSISYSAIHWLTSTEAEFLAMAKKAFLTAHTGISRELYDLAMVKGIQQERAKTIIQLDPLLRTLFRDCFPKEMYGVYQQAANIDSHYFQADQLYKTVDNIPLLTTDKKISLVITSKNDKMTEDVCRNLIRKDNLVILFSNTPTMILDSDGNVLPHVLSKTGSFRQKQFFPKLDYIWDFSKMDADDATDETSYTAYSRSLIETMNKLELVRLHNCSLTFLSDHDKHDELIYTFIKEYPQYRDRVEIIHVLFDKSERSDYVLHA